MFHLYGLLIGIGILAGIAVATYQAKKFGKHPKLVEDAVFWIFIPAIVGARLYHVVTDWQLYQNTSLFEIFSIWNGGLGFFGALIGGIFGLLFYVYHHSKQISSKTGSKVTQFFTLLDLLALGSPLAQAIGRFGNYFNQELYGIQTNLPWGMEIEGTRYHPLFLYEAILNGFVFLILNTMARKKLLPLGKGQYACIYLACYGVIRFWLEFLRPETARFDGTLGVFSIAQWVSLVLALIALTIFWLRRHADKGVEWELKKLL